MLAAILVGLAVKTPTVPFHTWLPPAHTDAPAVGSAVLAGVLLKMGTYGFVRIAMPMLPEAWRAWAWVVVAVGVVSVLYGALVALAQTNLKRMIAYTSVNHMGYVVLAVGAAGLVAGGTPQARDRGGHRRGHPDGQPRPHHRGAVPARRRAARTGPAPTTWSAYGGLAAPAPRVRRAASPSAAFASLGLPGFVRVHRRVPDLHRQHRRGCPSPRSRCPASSSPPRCSCGRCSGSSPGATARTLAQGFGDLRARRDLVGGTAAAARAAASGSCPAPCST